MHKVDFVLDAQLDSNTNPRIQPFDFSKSIYHTWLSCTY